MKKIFPFLLLLISVIAQGQNNQRIKENEALLFAPTEKGKPDGVLVSQKIGKDGGTLISSDNKITLIIPEGALSSETLISIQPTTNFAKGSIGKSYELEPSGIQFQKPVTLVFSYTEKDMGGQSPKLMGVAWQNDKAEWKGLSKITLDTVLKTITADITHFSAWVLGWAIFLEPEKTRIKVSKDMIVFLTQREVQDAPGGVTSEKIFKSDFRYQINWSVNGIPDGNSSVGKIVTVGTSLSRVYQAPAQVPGNNPVEIKLEITDIKKPESGQNITIIVGPKNTVTWTEQVWTIYPNTSRKCNVQVYDDEYEIKMIATLKGGTPKAWGGHMTYKDEGSFVVSLDKKVPELIRIFNRVEVVTYDNCPDRVILNPTTNTGVFHVRAAKQVKITPASPPAQPYRIVEIWFVPHPIEVTRFTYNCPPPPGSHIRGNAKGKIDLTTSVSNAPPPLMFLYGMPALPHYIKFLAKDGEQVIMETGKPGDEIYNKISVRKIEDDR